MEQALAQEHTAKTESSGIGDRAFGAQAGAGRPGSGLSHAEFEALYRSIRDDVFAYVASLVGRRSAAEDVTAAAFERAYRKRSRFDARRGAARSWVFGIARNAALDELRKQRSIPILDDCEAEHAVVGSDGRSAHEETSLDKVEIGRAMQTLSTSDRELIALRYFADLPLSEVASTLGISESSAGTKVHRALARLREAIDD